MMNSTSETKIIDVIATIRGAHIDNEWLYMEGQCYNFALILEAIFDDVEIWYDQIDGHVYSKIGMFWFDIRGIHYSIPSRAKLLDELDLDPECWGYGDARRLKY